MGEGVLSTFWLLFYWALIPLAVIAGIAFLVLSLRATFGAPNLQGRLLYQNESIHARSGVAIGSPPYRVWVTDREVVLRIRPGYRREPYAASEIRIPAAHVSSVLKLPSGAVRLGLTGGEGRYWDFGEPPDGLSNALCQIASRS